MSRTNFESLRVYKLSEDLADSIWEIALSWDEFARSTIAQAERFKPIINELAPKLNAYLKSIGSNDSDSSLS